MGTSAMDKCQELVLGASARSQCQELVLGASARSQCQELVLGAPGALFFEYCIFPFFLWLLSFLQFSNFSLNKSFETYLEPVLPPGGKSWQLISPHYNGTACFKKRKQQFEYQHLLLPRDIWWSKFYCIFKCCSFFQHQS